MYRRKMSQRRKMHKNPFFDPAAGPISRTVNKRIWENRSQVAALPQTNPVSIGDFNPGPGTKMWNFRSSNLRSNYRLGGV